MKQPKRLFYFATAQEAAGTRSKLEAHEQIAPGLYSCPYGYVRIGGMGILSAACSPSQTMDWDEVWNFGIAATLSSEFALETRAIVSSVERPTWFPDGLETRSKEWFARLFPRLHLTLDASKTTRLVSCDFPVHQTHLADTLRTHADLLDMEGYGLAFMAHSLKRPCFIGKWVSDSASVNGPEAIKRLLSRFSEHCADWVDELLKQPPVLRVPTL